MIADLGRYIASRQALAVSGRGPELVAGQELSRSVGLSWLA